MSGLLAWTVPSLMEVFSSGKKTYNYYDFNGSTLPAAVPATTTGVANWLNFEV
jgi:hypothetical protein